MDNNDDIACGWIPRNSNCVWHLIPPKESICLAMQWSYTASMNILPLHSDGMRSCHRLLPSSPEWPSDRPFCFLYRHTLTHSHSALLGSLQSHKPYSLVLLQKFFPHETPPFTLSSAPGSWYSPSSWLPTVSLGHHTEHQIFILFSHLTNPLPLWVQTT